MTTAHKPTFHPAMGTAHQGGYRYNAQRMQFSSLEMPALKKLKFRQIGQDAPEEIRQRNLLAELIAKEATHQPSNSPLDSAYIQLLVNPTKVEPKSAKNEPLTTQTADFDDADDSDKSYDSSAESSDEEEKELMAELKRIKEERQREAEESRTAAANEQKERDAESINSAVRENPLLSGESFEVQRRWDHDVVFRNQAREEKKVELRFINDTLRNDFHKKFIRKYVR